MRDQYNFLKAIDTSSSSPELKETHRSRRPALGQKQLIDAEIGSSSATSSNSNNNNKQHASGGGRDRAGLIRSKLQNLVRPRRFQLGAAGDNNKSGSSSQHQLNSYKHLPNERLHFARQEEDCSEQENEDEQDEATNGDNLDDSDEAPEEVVVAERPAELVGARTRPRLFAAAATGGIQRQSEPNSDTNDSKQQQVPIGVCQIKKRAQISNKRAQLLAAMKYREQQLPRLQYPSMAAGALRPPLDGSNMMSNQHAIANHQKKTSVAVLNAPNYSPSETTKQQLNGRQELAKCYEEIDQIYDYIRGLAPLPPNLRKIKAIDFEQIERERRRHKESQQAAMLVDPRQVHHQHRQRYVKSIESSSRSSSTAAEAVATAPTTRATTATTTTTNPNLRQESASGATKKSAKVRQRVIAELIRDRETPVKQAPLAKTSSKLRSTLQFIVPMPIRVTTKSGESHKPSIKRVESLNLGPINGHQHQSGRGEGPKPIEGTGKSAENRHQQSLTSLNLNTKPAHLITSSGPQGGGQLFRLPRAHSTSTLNQTAIASVDKRLKQKQKLVTEPVIQEDFPLVRVVAPPQTNHDSQLRHRTSSLGRTGPADGKRPSFESDLVDSYVDDDDDDDDDDDNDNVGDSYKAATPADARFNSTSRPNERLTKDASSSSGDGSGEESQDETESSNEDDEEDETSASSSDRWSYADDSSKNQRLADKSHSDYDNDSASATSETSATSASSSTTTTNASSNDDHDEHDELRRASNKAPSQQTSSSNRSHRLRPTTSSSPSSGRPASPVDTTNESDEMEMASATSHKSSFVSASRRRKPQSAATSMASQTLAQREEHIYEQIPAHKSGPDRSRSLVAASERHATRARAAPAAATHKASQSTTSRRTASNTNGGRPMAINHPVAYAANVAANRRYQQQVAALFALQQQRDRHQQLVARHKVSLGQSLAPSQHWRASASNGQFMSSQAPATALSGPLSPAVGSLKWKPQASRQLADVPHRQRLSMGNIHLLSGAIPFASLCSPQTKQPRQTALGQTTSTPKPARESKRAQNTTNSLDDHEAGSTGTTNSTSSYEAAIKNSEPDPLRIADMICPSDSEQSRHPSSKRSTGSGSGSRSLTNQSHHSIQSNNNSSHQTSTLMKVPKLSKQSHLLQRPLPKPPSTYRSYASSNPRQPQKSSSAARSTATSQTARSNAVDVFS
jgi:hypothetical protein